MPKKAIPESVQVEIEITGGNKKIDWYYDLIGKPMKAILYRDNIKKSAVALSFLDFHMVCEIKDGDFKVIKGKDIRNLV